MNSIKTKKNSHSIAHGKAIAGVVLLPKDGHFIGYVAWEWPEMADKKFFAICESTHLIGQFHPEWIDHIADYGTDVTHRKEIQKLFPQLF